MSFQNNLAEALQSVQTDLRDNVGINNPAEYGKLTGALDYQFSGDNPRTIETIMQQTAAGSKYRPVQIRTLPKDNTDDDYDAISAYNCNAVGMQREIVTTENPSLFAGTKFTIDEAIIREGSKESIQTRLATEIRRASRRNREVIDRKFFAAAATVLGSNPASSIAKGAYRTLQLLNSDGTVNANNFDEIKMDQMNNYQEGNPGIVGLGNMWRYMNRLGVGSGNDGGVDIDKINQQFGMAFYKDQQTTTVLGDVDKVLVFYPGLTQYYQYNYWRGTDFTQETPDLARKSTIQDDKYPQIVYDFHLKYDDGCSSNRPQGSWTGNLFVSFDLWTPPEAAWGEGYSANLNDFTGIVGYDITNA